MRTTIASPNNTVIRLEHVWKRFNLHKESQRSLQVLFIDLLQRKRKPKGSFWPLQDISFSVNAGDCLGIVGENGSGKSTILKLIAGVLEPTSGSVWTRGRIGALLELGAGFHPDLTGRENVYLNGSILGLNRTQIKRKMDAIVAFAELEPFIDVPVRHYSSGMYARLGFSVAVQSDPDILLVDEVLAVGDQNFQAKCVEKITEMRRNQVTVLWVTHDLPMVPRVCTHAIWIEGSMIQMQGAPDAVVAAYVGWNKTEAEARLADVNRQRVASMAAARKTPGQMPDGAGAAPAHRHGNGKIIITDVEMLNAADDAGWIFQANEQVRVRLHYEACEPFPAPVFSILIHRDDGLYVTSSNTHQTGGLPAIAGKGCVEVEFPAIEIARGAYQLSVAVYTVADPPMWADPADFHDRIYRFNIESDMQYHGVVAPHTNWRLLGSLPQGSGASRYQEQHG